MASGETIEEKHSEESFEFYCTMCKDGGRITEADNYCRDCCDYYCSKCIKVHDTVPALKRHKIIDKEQFKNEPGMALPMVPTESCVRHGHKPVDMYCENHDAVGCPTCMTNDHRSCKDIFYIPEYIQNTGCIYNQEDIRKKLDVTEKSLSENLRLFEQEKQTALQKQAESIRNIRQFRKEIKKKLDDLEKASVAEVEQKYAVVINKIEEAIRLINESMRGVQSAQNKLTDTDNNVSQAFVSATIARSVAVNAKRCLAEQRLRYQKEEIMFVPDQKLSDLLNDLITLGHSVHRSIQNTEDKLTDSSSQWCGLLQVKGMKIFPLSSQSELVKCDIVSSCVLDDGTVILADRNNRRLTRLDRSSYIVRDHFDLPGEPWQVCVISTQEVVASCQTKEIILISLKGTLAQNSIIKTDFDCYGLAFANGNLYISDYSTSVYMYSLLGKKLKQFSKNKSGRPLFSSTYLQPINSLAVSKDGSKIYIANSTKGLIVLDNNGQFLGKFGNSELERAIDVHVNSNEDLLVCGLDSNNVLQFGPDGEFVGEIIKFDSDKSCWTACCNRHMSKMIVGRQSYNGIEVYDMV